MSPQTDKDDDKHDTSMADEEEDDSDGVYSDDDSDDDDDDDDDSDSDSSDPDEDVELPDEQTLTTIMKLEKSLEDNPTSYATHNKLVRVLREAAGGALKRRLRAARESMSARFPLNETQWREWIADEVRATRGKRSRRAKTVGRLFERAVSDYLSVPLWLGYAEFSLDQGWDTTRRRELYERALSIAGLHFTEGHKIWAGYRAFELSQLETAATGTAGADEKEKEKEVKHAEERVRALLHRQLAVPHAQMDDTKAMAEEWERARRSTGRGSDGSASAAASDKNQTPPLLPPAILAANAKAAAAAAARQPHEDAIAAAAAAAGTGTGTGPSSSEKNAAAAAAAALLSKAYRAYVTLEESSGDPSRAQCLHERAVKATPTDPATWRRYTAYLDHVLRVRTVSATAHGRAVRNCPTHGDTWAVAMRAAEQRALVVAAAARDGAGAGGADEGEDPTSALMEQALGAGLGSGDDYLAVFMARLDVLRRAGDGAGFRATAQLARETLSEFFPGYVDRQLSLPSYWATTEIELNQDERAARGVWDAYTTADGSGSGDGETRGEYANIAEAHVAHAEFLWRKLGDVEAARGVYKRCYARAGLESIAAAASGGGIGSSSLGSGSRFGTGMGGQAVVCRAWLLLERESGTADTYATADAKAGAKLRIAEAEAAEKRVLNPEEAKRMRQANDPNFKGGSAAGGKTTSAEPLVVGGKGNKRKAGAGDVEGDDDESVRPSAKRARDGDVDVEGNEENGGEGTTVSLPSDSAARAAKYKEYYPDRDQRTAFVKNLPFKLTEEELAAFFDARGGKVTARIVRDKSTGRSRGFAYVEFSEEGALQVAIMRDGIEFQGRKLSIARSMPPGGGGGGGGGGKSEKGNKPSGITGVVGGGAVGAQRRGPKGLGFAGMMPRAARAQAASAAAGSTGSVKPTATTTEPDAGAKGSQGARASAGAGGGGQMPKSNADFRAMFLSGFKKGGNLE